MLPGPLCCLFRKYLGQNKDTGIQDAHRELIGGSAEALGNIVAFSCRKDCAVLPIGSTIQYSRTRPAGKG